jgi:hypothetical protein
MEVRVWVYDDYVGFTKMASSGGVDGERPGGIGEKQPVTPIYRVRTLAGKCHRTVGFRSVSSLSPAPHRFFDPVRNSPAPASPLGSPEMRASISYANAMPLASRCKSTRIGVAMVATVTLNKR